MTRVALGLVAGLLLAWLLLVAALLVARPRGSLLREALRLLPDLLVLLTRLARDRDLPRGVRVRIGLLVGYLAVPFDLVPDFLPVIGQVDDAVVAVLVLRSVVRRVGLAPLERRWPGTPDGFAALVRLTGLRSAAR